MTMGDLEMQVVDSSCENAVYIRGAYKRYGTASQPIVVFENLNMTVRKGIIYGLLGASGCGKTTLLNCIVGRLKLNAGELSVFGNYGVIGSTIGYMPQQISLYGEFSIIETMKYFGWLADMTTSQIEERLAFLSKLLELPNMNENIKNLSGGQQRRVSFATSLLHEPKLLILDEPTVGLDPLLRENVWSYLLNIIDDGGTTVILTTHYIDETKQAHQIGLMRGGHILTEESPSKLLSRYKVNTLEEVFLKLSVWQNNKSSDGFDNKGLDEGNAEPISVIESKPSAEDVNFITKKPKSFQNRSCVKLSYLKPLIWKNGLWMLKNWPLMFTIFAIPSITVILFYLCIGSDPRNLKVAVVNYEMNSTTCTTLSCDSKKLSCNYFELLKTRDLNLIYYDSEIEARASVLRGKTYASIVVRHNFSDALRSRLIKMQKSNEWDITYSTIEVFRDVSIKDVAQFIKMYLTTSFIEFLGNYAESCNGTRHGVNMPIKWNDPIYGMHKSTFTEFSSVGVIISVGFMIAAALTAGAMLVERIEGIFDRTLVMGVSLVEILISHLVCEFVIVALQAVSMLIVFLGIFKMILKGSLILITMLIVLNGFCGMWAGVALGCISKSERTVAYILMGSFMLIVFVSGILWPIQAVHYALRPITYIIPLSHTIESMRSILQKGWGLEEPSVYLGFVSLLTWILIFIIITFLIIKFKKY